MNEKQKQNYRNARHALKDRFGYVYNKMLDKAFDDYRKENNGELPDKNKRTKIEEKVKKEFKDGQKDIEKKRFRRLVSIFGMTVALGATSFITAHTTKALTEGKYKEAGIELQGKDAIIDTSKLGKLTVEIENPSNKDQTQKFMITNINGANKTVQVNGYNYDEIEKAGEQYAILKQNIESQVDSLKTKDDVLNYAKEMFIEEYNDKNNTNFTSDKVNFYVTRNNEKIIYDKAENGDKIYRNVTSEGYEEKKNSRVGISEGLLSVYIDGNIVERGIIDKDTYQHVFNSDEKIESAQKDTYLTGPVLINASDYMSVVDNQYSSDKNIYKQRLVYTSAKYKKNEIDKIITQKYTDKNQVANQEKTDDDYEIE